MRQAPRQVGLFGQTILNPITGAQGELFDTSKPLALPRNETADEAKIRRLYRPAAEATGDLFADLDDDGEGR